MIGYDPLNEPLPSNPIRDPFLLLPGTFDQEQLDPLYSKLFKIYDKNSVSRTDPNVMFFEPGQWPDQKDSKVFSLGFKNPPGGKNGSN